MAERLDVRISFEVKDSKDGSDFVGGNFLWSGVPYEAFVMMEKSFNSMMNGWADASLADKKAKGK